MMSWLVVKCTHMQPKLNNGDEVIVAVDVDIAFKLDRPKCLMFATDETFMGEFFVPPWKDFKDIVNDKVDELYYKEC